MSSAGTNPHLQEPDIHGRLDNRTSRDNALPLQCDAIGRIVGTRPTTEFSLSCVPTSATGDSLVLRYAR
jgi:hypothetical protein